METTLKIGLTGPSGSGKTTLANYIMDKFNVPFIPGSASLISTDTLYKHLNEKYGYVPQGHRNVINLSNTNPDFGYDFQMGIMESRAKKLSEAGSFVTDRTIIDNIAYFLMQCSHNQDEKLTELYLRQAIFNLKEIGFTHIFLIKPNNGWTEDNGSRVANNFYQKMTYSVFLHVYENYIKDVAYNIGLRIQILDTWNLEIRKNIINNSILGINAG